MSNHAHRRHRRRRRPAAAPRVRAAHVVDLDQAARWMGACDCPAVVTSRAGLVAVEHYHEPGCPNLTRQLGDRREP